MGLVDPQWHSRPCSRLAATLTNVWLFALPFVTDLAQLTLQGPSCQQASKSAHRSLARGCFVAIRAVIRSCEALQNRIAPLIAHAGCAVHTGSVVPNWYLLERRDASGKLAINAYQDAAESAIPWRRGQPEAKIAFNVFRNRRTRGTYQHCAMGFPSERSQRPKERPPQWSAEESPAKVRESFEPGKSVSTVSRQLGVKPRCD